MTVAMITYCDLKKINSVLLNKKKLKQILSGMLISYIAKKQTSANIMEYMVNQVLF